MSRALFPALALVLGVAAAAAACKKTSSSEENAWWGGRTGTDRADKALLASAPYAMGLDRAREFSVFLDRLRTIDPHATPLTTLPDRFAREMVDATTAYLEKARRSPRPDSDVDGATALRALEAEHAARVVKGTDGGPTYAWVLGFAWRTAAVLTPPELRPHPDSPSTTLGDRTLVEEKAWLKHEDFVALAARFRGVYRCGYACLVDKVATTPVVPLLWSPGLAFFGLCSEADQGEGLYQSGDTRMMGS